MTEIDKEAIEAAKAAYWHEAHNGGGYSDKCYEAALTAALPFLSTIAGEGKVKALEWRECGEEVWSADAALTKYYIARANDGKFHPRLHYIGDVYLEPCDTLETAKEAAQADYRTRILSALTPCELVSLQEAAQSLLDRQNKEPQTVGYRLDLWRVLEACLSSPGKDGWQEVEAVEVSAKFLDRLSEALGRISWYDDSDNRLTTEQMADRLIARVARARAAENREEMARFGSPQPASTALVERLTKALEPFAEAADYFSNGVHRPVAEDALPCGPALLVRHLREARSAFSASQSTSRENAE